MRKGMDEDPALLERERKVAEFVSGFVGDETAAVGEAHRGKKSHLTASRIHLGLCQ